jgi:signal transduction histidine kinase
MSKLMIRRYRAGLRAYLASGRDAGMGGSGDPPAATAKRIGLPKDLVAVHERLLLKEFLPRVDPGMRDGLVLRAAEFLAAAEGPSGYETAAKTDFRRALMVAMSRHAVDLASTNEGLVEAADRHQATETNMRNREKLHAGMLEASKRLQNQLRNLSRQILSAQEDERRRISRELHDVIAQTLSGINVQLANLKMEASRNSRSLDRNIARTQRMVERSVEMVHRFARELRPAALDDLGLVPTLQSYLRHFTMETGIRTRLAAFDGLNALSTLRRTTLYRIVQEALTNVAKHSKATNAAVSIECLPRRLRLRISDDGHAFDVAAVQNCNAGRRLGLLGMQERAEMIGGCFSIDSNPGKGTTVAVVIPFRHPSSPAPKSPAKNSRSRKSVPKAP